MQTKLMMQHFIFLSCYRKMKIHVNMFLIPKLYLSSEQQLGRNLHVDSQASSDYK